MDRAATDAVPGSSTVTASAAGAPTWPHTPWQLLAGTTTVCGLGRCARPYVLDPRTWLLSPHAPLGCICPSHTPMVPFSAPVSFSPGNPRRLLCLSPSLTLVLSLALSVPHGTPHCAFFFHFPHTTRFLSHLRSLHPFRKAFPG